jgi:hypothetical protein
MADCTTGFEYILKQNGDPTDVAMNLLKQIEEKEMALTIVRNDQQRMMRIGADTNSMKKLKMVSETIVSHQEEEKRKKENLEFARKFKQDQARSSIASDGSSTQPQTGMSSMSDEERQKKIEEDRKKRLAEYEAAQASKKSAVKKKKKYFGLFGGNKTKKSKKGMSLCAKKTAKKCTRVRGCKIASGSKRTYCRKKKNHTKKSHNK